MSDILSSGSTDIPGTLKRAAVLMKDGDKEAALQLVKDVLKTDQNSADAWYLMACLVTEREKQVQALNHALQINPQHFRAQQMLTKV